MTCSQISDCALSICKALRAPCGERGAGTRLVSLSATVPINFPVRSDQISCQSALPPLLKTSNPFGDADASMCQVLTSLAIPLTTLADASLKTPEFGSKRCAIN